MKEAFCFAASSSVVVSEEPRLITTVQTILAQQVIVITPTVIGNGVVIANRIITSLLLVANFPLVRIVLPSSEVAQATVTRRDFETNLAELQPVLLGGEKISLTQTEVKLGRRGGIGDALLIPVSDGSASHVQVAGMKYLTRLAERWQDSWRIDPGNPPGVIGGGVWTTEGEFVGLSLGRKIPRSPEAILDVVWPTHDVYAATADTVLNFAESH